MKLAEYAARCGVTYKTAWNWYKAGRVHGYRMGRTIIVTDSPPQEASPLSVVTSSVSETMGRYREYLPTDLLKRYQNALGDRDLLVLRDEIAVSEVRIQELLQRVRTGESGQAWRDARDALQDLKGAGGDPDKVRDALLALEKAVGRGSGDYLAWAEVREVTEQRRRLAESERRRLVELQNVLTAEQAGVLVMALHQAVLDILDKLYTNRDSKPSMNKQEARQEIGRMFAKLMTMQGVENAGVADGSVVDG